jgi:hypothetical protein
MMAFTDPHTDLKLATPPSSLGTSSRQSWGRKQRGLLRGWVKLYLRDVDRIFRDMDDIFAESFGSHSPNRGV